MSGEATVQLLDSSIDRDGLSVVTTTKTVDNPRLGSMYNPLMLAAVVPVWFQPLRAGSYLAVFKGHWEQATIGTGGPQTYSAYTEVNTPSWVTIDPLSGFTSGQAEIPSRLSGDRVLIDACTRGEYLFTIGTVADVPFIQHHRIDDRGNIVLQAEEIVSNTVLEDLEITWFNGVYIDGAYLVVIGTDDSAGGVYRRRKPWGRVGQGNEPWTYKGPRGWYVDPTEVEAETAASGTLTAATAVSYAKIKDREWLCTNDGTTARFWSSRMVDTVWKKADLEVAADLVYLQPQLYYNPAALPDGVNVAVPYVASTRHLVENENSLQVSWGFLPV